MNNHQRLQAIYDKVPAVACKQLCQDSCGPIMMTNYEWKRVCAVVGHKPKGKPSLECPLLKDGECSVYAVRPLICRLWGVVREMRCPHGCEPVRWLSDAEARSLLEEANRISGVSMDAALRLLKS